jgi:hypothetical protein
MHLASLTTARTNHTRHTHHFYYTTVPLPHHCCSSRCAPLLATTAAPTASPLLQLAPHAHIGMGRVYEEPVNALIHKVAESLRGRIPQYTSPPREPVGGGLCVGKIPRVHPRVALVLIMVRAPLPRFVVRVPRIEPSLSPRFDTS